MFLEEAGRKARKEKKKKTSCVKLKKQSEYGRVVVDISLPTAPETQKAFPDLAFVAD